MEKIIIKINDGVPNARAMRAALAVVEDGRISTTSYGPQYCFHTVFKDGVTVGVRKSKSGTEVFYIGKES